MTVETEKELSIGIVVGYPVCCLRRKRCFPTSWAASDHINEWPSHGSGRWLELSGKPVKFATAVDKHGGSCWEGGYPPGRTTEVPGVCWAASARCRRNYGGCCREGDQED